MGMQTDVKSFHASSSALAYGDRARLKGVIISPTTSTTYNPAVADTVGGLSGTYDIPGSTTCTVTITNHGLTNGDRVALNFTSGTGVDDCYTVANVTTDTFTVTTASLTTSGNVTMYPRILTEIDCASGTSFYTLIPGEGILATGGIFCLLPDSVVTMTIFYG
jgi:hypothetical protein